MCLLQVPIVWKLQLTGWELGDNCTKIYYHHHRHRHRHRHYHHHHHHPCLDQYLVILSDVFQHRIHQSSMPNSSCGAFWYFLEIFALKSYRMSSSFHSLFRRFFKLFVLGAFAISSGILFHIAAVLGVNEYFLMSYLALWVKILFEFLLGPDLGAMSFHTLMNLAAFLSYFSFINLKTSIMSPRIGLYERVGEFSSLSLSLYVLSFIPESVVLLELLGLPLTAQYIWF